MGSEQENFSDLLTEGTPHMGQLIDLLNSLDCLDWVEWVHSCRAGNNDETYGGATVLIQWYCAWLQVNEEFYVY